MGRIELLDCTLRDGAYIVDGKFGARQISGVLNKLQQAKVDIIECGWLKDEDNVEGSSYFHIPEDIGKYITERGTQKRSVMIDYNRYDDGALSKNSGEFIDIIRIVFPKGKVTDGIKIGERIREKGYSVFFQIANTPGYSDIELLEMIKLFNEFGPEALFIVDTFGCLDQIRLERILNIVEYNLDKKIKLGFHSHNNQQLSFALSVFFIEWLMAHSKRNIIVDSSLMGMGRGAGNSCTELISHHLNEKYHENYDLNEIMDCIDMFIQPYSENHKWGYSVQYALAGMFGCHVNNVAYLNDVHRIKCKEMLNVFGKMDSEKRILYDYDDLEKKYLECLSCEIDDKEYLKEMAKQIGKRRVVLVLPGKSSETDYATIKKKIGKNDYIIGVNSVLDKYDYDLVFFSNRKKYEFYSELIYEREIPILFTSNVRCDVSNVVNYNSLVRGDWKYRENSTLLLLRLLAKIGIDNICFIGFDGYSVEGRKYVERALQPAFSNPSELKRMQGDIEEMLYDFCYSFSGRLEFLTESSYEPIVSAKRKY